MEGKFRKSFSEGRADSKRPPGVLDAHELIGILGALDESILIIPAGLMHSVQEVLTNNFGPIVAANVLYDIGKQAGRYYLKVLESAGHKTGDILFWGRTREELSPFWGWKRLHAMEFDAGRKFARLRLTGSMYVISRRGKIPVCHFGRGMAAGSLGAIFGTRSESIEVACEGKRDDHCELITGTPMGIVRVVETLG